MKHKVISYLLNCVTWVFLDTSHTHIHVQIESKMMMMMMIGVLRPLLCTKVGRATSKCDKAKSKMKHPSDMPTPRFELRW